jgi:hypothetical protein
MGSKKGRTRKLAFAAATFAVALIVIAICGEILARLSGVEPWDPRPIGVVVEPGGRYFQQHPTLGYSHLPGSFTITMPQTSLTYHVTHLPDTLRVTHPLETYAAGGSGKEEIWIFGGSFTYGWGLDDDETFPWVLQESFPEFEVVNFGVSGYGTLISLLQFEEALARGRRPRIAVIAYATFHDMRNTFLRRHRKGLVQGNRLGPLVLPYARLDAEGQLEIRMADSVYREFPLMRRSALAHLLDTFYNHRIEDRFVDSAAVTRAILTEFQGLCEENGIRLVVAGIDDWRGTPMPGFLEERGISFVEIWVDLSDPRYVNSRDVFHHPNALAHRLYARRIEEFLRDDSGRLPKTAE